MIAAASLTPASSTISSSTTIAPRAPPCSDVDRRVGVRDAARLLIVLNARGEGRIPGLGLRRVQHPLAVVPQGAAPAADASNAATSRIATNGPSIARNP